MSRPVASRGFPLLAPRHLTRSSTVCRICAQHRSACFTPTLHKAPEPVTRHFASSAFLLKKAGKKARDTAKSDSSPPGPAVAPNTATDEIYDFSVLESNILKAIERLTHKLSELRAGGRFNPSILESLKVQLDKGGANAKLRDLAQVVTRGRTISVIVGEEDHVRPVSSAILASAHSLNPQGPSPDAPTTLTIQIPPPTGESRRAAIEDARKFSEEATAAIRAARQTQHKKMRSMELEKRARPDDLQKAHKQMEEVVRKGNEEVKRIVDGAKRVLESA
ncbi:ribosome recycling factor [Rhizodiscina lignyota]|uniref:Ribosome recycling factor n=1 Tax=Rhizodiscina lignyota TaxID=1504668 RepID=A0A9P4M0T5_9PEZI|nr:ribosome recycling factor [Rhizodiscina lignyota]